MTLKEHKRIVVLGGGESGYGSAVLARVKGHEVFLSDSGAISQEYTGILDRYGIEYEQGGHTPEKIYSADLIVKSPGIPETAPVMREIRRRMISVISEIELGGFYSKGRKICITGSNGKTTTTTLTYEILRNAGYDVALAGNIGKSYAYTVATEDREWYVMELSSFQLDDTFYFRADTAVLLNITPDHLNRYDNDFGKYVDSKMRIIRNQTHKDHIVMWADDHVIPREIARRMPNASLLPFSSVEPEPQGAFLEKNGMISVSAGDKRFRIDTSRMKIRGLHNAYNTMAAALAAITAGVDEETILGTVYGFGGVEHRMEFVAEVNGVEYINDSKATNVDSVWYALESMRRPVVWIAGGTDKGNDYDPLKDLAKKKVRVLVCLGVDNSKLLEGFSGIVPEIYDTHSMGEAMEICARIAAGGDTVLLSPACASFDLFENYEDRGRQFKEQVRNLESRAARA